MKKKNWMLPGFMIILVAAFILIAGFSSKNPVEKDKPRCCIQKMDAPGVLPNETGGENCDDNSINPKSSDFLLENLSRQFLTILP